MFIINERFKILNKICSIVQNDLNYYRKFYGYTLNKVVLAALAYNNKAKELFGEFANLNNVE